MPTFQYTTIKMIIFCACKNLLNKKKNVKGYQNRCVKRPRKIFGGRFHSCGCCDDYRTCEQLKKRVQTNVLWKKVRLWTRITFRYMKCILPLQYLSDWCLHGVHAWQKFQGEKNSDWVIATLATLSVLQSFGFPWNDPSCKGNSLTRVSWALQAQIVTWGPK